MVFIAFIFVCFCVASMQYLPSEHPIHVYGVLLREIEELGQAVAASPIWPHSSDILVPRSLHNHKKFCVTMWTNKLYKLDMEVTDTSSPSIVYQNSCPTQIQWFSLRVLLKPHIRFLLNLKFFPTICSVFSKMLLVRFLSKRFPWFHRAEGPKALMPNVFSSPSAVNCLNSKHSCAWPRKRYAFFFESNQWAPWWKGRFSLVSRHLKRYPTQNHPRGNPSKKDKRGKRYWLVCEQWYLPRKNCRETNGSRMAFDQKFQVNVHTAMPWRADEWLSVIPNKNFHFLVSSTNNCWGSIICNLLGVLESHVAIHLVPNIWRCIFLRHHPYHFTSQPRAMMDYKPHSPVYSPVKACSALSPFF